MIWLKFSCQIEFVFNFREQSSKSRCQTNMTALRNIFLMITLLALVFICQESEALRPELLEQALMNTLKKKLARNKDILGRETPTPAPSIVDSIILRSILCFILPNQRDLQECQNQQEPNRFFEGLNRI